MQVARRSLSLSIKIIYNQVLRDKKKEPAVFWSANFPRLRRQFKYILNNFRLSKLEETMKKNISIYAEKKKPRWPEICWNQVKSYTSCRPIPPDKNPGIPPILGFHMTSPKFKLGNYRFFWVSEFHEVQHLNTFI